MLKLLILLYVIFQAHAFQKAIEKRVCAQLRKYFYDVLHVIN